MLELNFSQTAFDEMVRVCGRVLVNEGTPLEDFRCYLVLHLQDRFPDTAARLTAPTDEQMERLATLVLQAVRAGTGSALWA